MGRGKPPTVHPQAPPQGKNGTEKRNGNGKPNGKRKPLSINGSPHFFPFFRLIPPLPHRITPSTQNFLFTHAQPKITINCEQFSQQTKQTYSFLYKTEKRKTYRKLVDRVGFSHSVFLSVSIPFFRFKTEKRKTALVKKLGGCFPFSFPIPFFLFFVWCGGSCGWQKAWCGCGKLCGRKLWF